MSATLTKIPILDPRPEIESIWPEVTAALEDVLKTGQFIMGPNVTGFEAEAAAYLGVKHAVGVNSGTDALILGVHALGLRPGDEVITTPFTFFATTECVSHFRATPVFVDIDPETFNFRVDQIEAAITERTKGIIPVHLFGQPIDMDPLMALAEKHGLWILEDVAQAFGGDYKNRKLGSIGHAGAFSFFPTKNLGGCGDGGLFTTNDDAAADLVRMLRVHGAKKKYNNEMVGVNSRLDAMQAAILRCKLPHIDEWNAGRRAAARRYSDGLAEVEGVVTPREEAFGTHVFHQYTVRILGGRRDEVQQKLDAAGVGTMVYYEKPLHKLPVYKDMAVSMPVSEQCAAEVLSLPIWPKIAPEVQDRVIGAIKEALR
ncbi:MAG: DegT/DnrJ/EryC1/StrS family aminotransferase [Fimbriimonadaceae bacterium]|nr:DegT/DnrJ/EryC1/StrS family aminotransferase [Fimbriimonadaceae bacterium]QYK55871.1 MAG: DegT/DnrJ/EryC1/StrS family aminotransferase [Fimbriimonadaceae bacterium]